MSCSFCGGWDDDLLSCRSRRIAAHFLDLLLRLGSTAGDLLSWYFYDVSAGAGTGTGAEAEADRLNCEIQSVTGALIW
eukprot:scaffold206627_cov27-Attheya_sp.AAC.1